MQGPKIISQLAGLPDDESILLDDYNIGDIISGFNFTSDWGKINDYYKLLSCYLELKPKGSNSDIPHPPTEKIDTSFEVIGIKKTNLK